MDPRWLRKGSHLAAALAGCLRPLRSERVKAGGGSLEEAAKMQFTAGDSS